MTSCRHTATCLIVALALLASPALAIEFQIIVDDPPGFGFNDPTPVSPVPGNPGTTLGAQRLIALQAAADAIGEVVQGGIARVLAYFDPSLPCTQTTAILGRGGPWSSFRDFINAPLRNTWYTSATADSLSGADQDEGDFDLRVFFNPNVDSDPSCLGGRGFFYGTIGVPSGGQAFFFETAGHEISHGLGFITLVDRANGARALGRNDVFMVRLEDHSLNMTWPQMTDFERVASTTDQGDLHWVGRAVTSDSLDLLDEGVDLLSGHVEIRAESPFDESNVVHWASELVPDELMEAGGRQPPSQKDVTLRAFADLGYTVKVGDTETCREGPEALCLNQQGRFEIEVWWRDFAGNRNRAGALPFARDSGLFFFLDAGNVELLIKVLNGCGVNQHFWVFYAATTNLEFDIRVTDTETGAIKTYSNLLGDPARTITDTSAFASCPGSSARTPRDAFEVAPSFDTSAARPVLGLASLDETDPRPDEKQVTPAPLRLSSDSLVSSLGIQGNRYGVAPLVAGDLNRNGALEFSEIISLQQDPTGNEVRFNGTIEDLSPFGHGLNRIPRANEAAQVLNNGNVRLTLTMTSNDGGDLFPRTTLGGTPLTDLVYRLGSRAGGSLDFLNLRVVSARFEGFDGNRRLLNSDIPIASFFTTPWDGDFGVIFSDQTGRGIDRVVLTLEAEVPITESMVAPSNCVPGAKVLCLNRGRFKVEMEWRDFRGDTGRADGIPIPGSTVSGLFYFFDAENIEVLLKLLDGCGLSNNFWVFLAATTNVEFTLTVTDTQTGRVRKYFNPLRQIANAITDTSAFPTC